MNNTNALAIIVVSLGLFFLFGKPMLADISDLGIQKNGYEESIDKVNSIGETESALRAKINAIPADTKKKIDTIIPDKQNFVRLATDINGIANKHGIVINDFTFDNQSKTAPTIAERATSRHYESGMLKFSFSARYIDLSSFLRDLEASLRLVDIREIGVSTLETGIYNYTVSAEIYWLGKTSISINNQSQTQ